MDKITPETWKQKLKNTYELLTYRYYLWFYKHREKELEACLKGKYDDDLPIIKESLKDYEENPFAGNIKEVGKDKNV